jgi:predicted nucleic acid-binding protein
VERFVLDTNIYIRAIRNAAARAELARWQRSMAPQIWQHSVVISELLVGARDEATWKRWYERWVVPAERVGRVVTPEYGAWLRASRIVARLTESGRIREREVKPNFFNDCLIAATAREHGHAIVTQNRQDFELISLVEPAVRTLPPYPSSCTPRHHNAPQRHSAPAHRGTATPQYTHPQAPTSMDGAVE